MYASDMSELFGSVISFIHTMEEKSKRIKIGLIYLNLKILKLMRIDLRRILLK